MRPLCEKYNKNNNDNNNNNNVLGGDETLTVTLVLHKVAFLRARPRITSLRMLTLDTTWSQKKPVIIIIRT